MGFDLVKLVNAAPLVTSVVVLAQLYVLMFVVLMIPYIVIWMIGRWVACEADDATLSSYNPILEISTGALIGSTISSWIFWNVPCYTF
ncbi:MAG: hypothetical protein CMJ78_10915 [Planctomycetaceae bacterium]|nr:hypothetical protein [Planctomycetaceae bacterium]